MPAVKRPRAAPAAFVTMQYLTLCAMINYGFNIDDPSFNAVSLWKVPSGTRPSEWKSLAYGELELNSVLGMIADMDLKPADVFLDIGAGTCKVAMSVALASEVGKVIGVEVVKERFDAGLHALARLVAVGVPGLLGRVMLVNDDVRNVDLEDVTVVYIANTVFGSELMVAIVSLLVALPRLRRVIVTEKLCSRHTTLCSKLGNACKVFKELFSRPIRVTWQTEKSPSYTVYDIDRDTPTPAPSASPATAQPCSSVQLCTPTASSQSPPTMPSRTPPSSGRSVISATSDTEDKKQVWFGLGGKKWNFHLDAPDVPITIARAEQRLFWLEEGVVAHPTQGTHRLTRAECATLKKKIAKVQASLTRPLIGKNLLKLR
jgi:hypothetical protein